MKCVRYSQCGNSEVGVMWTLHSVHVTQQVSGQTLRHFQKKKKQPKQTL